MDKLYLIDESVIVFLERDDYQYKAQLIAFFEDGKIGVPEPKRKHCLFMPYLSKIRLGNFRLYKMLSLGKRTINHEEEVVNPLAKASRRAGMTKKFIVKYLKLSWWYRTILCFWKRKKIIDLFLYANEKKSKSVQREFNKKIDSNQIIPLEICEIAMLAHMKKMPIISFNKDFLYLMRMPGVEDNYIQYIHPDDLLKEYFNPQH